MLSEQIIIHFRQYAWLVFVGFVLRVLINKYGRGLHKIPGPQLASFTDLWRLFAVWGRRPEAIHIKLHENHGDLVRLGPRTVSVADPEAIKTIYALNAGFVKSDFYPVQQTIAKGRPLHSIFNTTDEKFHARLRRTVSNAYAMSTLVNFEAHVDSTSTEFLKQLQQRYADRTGVAGECDLGTWLQYYAFDVIGELTYSRRLGFVDGGVDVDHIIRDLEWLLNYVSVVGQIPFLDHLLLKNPIRLWMSKCSLINANAPVVNFASTRCRGGADAKVEETLTINGSTSRDFLSRFIEARAKDPTFVSEERVLALTVANMFAGSDTTAISLRATFYYLLKNPLTMSKLMAELFGQKKFTKGDALVKWEEVRELPYLSAVIKESLRCHPAVGLPLERVVPPQGISIASQFLPGGTIVGCSAWVVHRNETIFGPKPTEFYPERWIEASESQKAAMNNYLFSFGAGSRTCLGKNISLVEMYKLVPAVLRSFEVKLVHPEKSWTLHNAWFVKQSGFQVRLKTRTGPP